MLNNCQLCGKRVIVYMKHGSICHKCNGCHLHCAPTMSKRKLNIILAKREAMEWKADRKGVRNDNI